MRGARAALRAGPGGSGCAHDRLPAVARASSPPPARSAFALHGLTAGPLPLLVALVALFLVGCGTTAPDLFLLTRVGSLPGARLTLLVNDSGTVRCNGGAARGLSDPQLLAARRIQEDVADDAKKDLVLPARTGSLLRFHIRTQDGTVTFSDVDAGTRPELGRLIAFTRMIAQDVCGLAR